MVRSTMVPTAELDATVPMTRSPSWWPGTSRPATSGGRWPMGTEPMSFPRVSGPRPRGRRAARPERSDAFSSRFSPPRG